jgi:hypothetical protein
MKKIMAAPNTDNKGKLFVTVFALHLHPSLIRNGRLTRTRASARNLNPTP